ncbi:hypothetical protein ACFLSF_03100 [Candidatus Bipolaricaulota bacterium]
MALHREAAIGDAPTRDTGSRKDRRRLGRLAPTRKLTGPWLPVLALCFVLGGLVLDATVGAVFGLVAVVVGVILAWFGRDAKWRGMAYLALYLGIFLVLVFLVVLVIGRSNIGELTQSSAGS